MSKESLVKVYVNPAQATQAVEHIMQAGLVPMLHGSPGVGKSSIVRAIADDFGLQLIDLRLGQCDPTDLLGYPNIDRERDRAGYAPMDTFPIEGDPLPKGKVGWLLFLDEFSSADRSVQKAAYKLVLDRQVGKYNLHSKVVMVCAGNLNTDNAIVEEMSTALQSRMVHLEVSIDNNTWLDWAAKSGIHHYVTDYINFKPGMLFDFNPTHSDKTFPCPRTWEFVSKLVDKMGITNSLILEVLAGTVGVGAAREFIAFTKIYADLPTIPEIVRAPGLTAVPTAPGTIYALTGSIAHNADRSNIDKLMVYIDRLPMDFQVVTLRGVIRRDLTMMDAPSIVKWRTEKAKDFF